jgi:DNA-binding transcriptional regulator YhcF (GntR family)
MCDIEEAAMPEQSVEPEAPLIQLNETSPLPKYAQIVEQIRRLIAEGELAPGAPLPSIRQLASDLGINVHTVLAAYHALESEEMLLLRHGSRAIVHPRLSRTAAPLPGDVAHIRSLLERTRIEARLRGMSMSALQALAGEVFGEALPNPGD